MAVFDVEAALRWATRIDRERTLAHRPDGELNFAVEGEIGGRPQLLDTCNYIDELQGTAPAGFDRALKARWVNRSTIAVQELMHAAGVGGRVLFYRRELR